MSRPLGRFGLVASILTLASCGGSGGSNEQPLPPAASVTGTGIEGAWRLSQFTLAGGAPVTVATGLYLFTQGHYSVMYVNTPTARAAFADPLKGTNPEKLAAYDALTGNAGSYVLSGDTVTVRPLISKNPNYMGGGEDKFVLRISGDTLWLTSVPGAFRWATGPVPTPATVPDVFTLLRAR